MSGSNAARAWLVQVAPWALCACLGASGCAQDAAEPIAGTGGVGGAAGMGAQGGAGGQGGLGGAGGASICTTFDTMPCTCGALPGRATCSSAGVWSLCECAQSMAGAGGTVSHDPALDPEGNRRDDIMFEWQQTTLDDCEAGRYEGTFTCTYVGMGQDPAMGGVLVTGPIVMTLTESENGEFLEITDGRLDGNTAGIINFTSALSGRLNCATREFGARAEMGLWGPFFPVNPFDGVLDAHYDALTSTLSGEWALNELATMGVCSGPWNAHRVGP